MTRMCWRVHPAAVAIATDGTILLNVAVEGVDPDPVPALRVALATGCRVFIGVAATPGEARRIRLALANAGDEAGAKVLARRSRRRRIQR